MNYPPSIQKLIDLFSKFPTVGPKTAARFVFYLLKSEKKDAEELTYSISKLKNNIKFCSFCFNPFELTSTNKNNEFCKVCSNASRDKSLLCVVEKAIDLLAVEKINKYKGRYFILGGAIRRFKKESEKSTRVEELKKRVRHNSEIKEIIIATNSTTEGEITALYLERELKPFNKKITRLARGLPVGGELEYADSETLRSALEGRK